VIYGLLQTEAYARALMMTASQLPSKDEFERRLTFRMKRQERLASDDIPEMWITLNEAALRRQVGGPETMREQLERLIQVSRLNSMTLQVLPFSAGAHPATHGGFEMLGFPEAGDPDVVYVEYWRGSIYLESAPDIDGYAKLFDHLRARALGPDESRALISQLAEEMA
jgi:hypothetical protein